LISKLPGMVQALLKPEVYPEPTDVVELEQTQMSFVFLTDNYAYKVKKPVNLGYLDYTTLENRRYYCYREVELNKRLCPDAYLGVLTINRQQDSFSIGGAGKVIEYAVKMRRLPRELMMDSLLESNGVSTEMISRLADRIAVFHKQAETSTEISTFGKVDVISRNTEENFSQTEKYIGRTVSSHQYQQIKEYNHRFIIENADLFKIRVKDNRIRDCHGDLHTAHICFENGICIYDCIEFNGTAMATCTQPTSVLKTASAFTIALSSTTASDMVMLPPRLPSWQWTWTTTVGQTSATALLKNT